MKLFLELLALPPDIIHWPSEADTIYFACLCLPAPSTVPGIQDIFSDAFVSNSIQERVWLTPLGLPIILIFKMPQFENLIYVSLFKKNKQWENRGPIITRGPFNFHWKEKNAGLRL